MVTPGDAERCNYSERCCRSCLLFILTIFPMRFFCLHTNKKQLSVFIQFWCTAPVIKSLGAGGGRGGPGLGGEAGGPVVAEVEAGNTSGWVGAAGRAQGGSGQDVCVQRCPRSPRTARAGSPDGHGAGGPGKCQRTCILARLDHLNSEVA